MVCERGRSCWAVVFHLTFSLMAEVRLLILNHVLGQESFRPSKRDGQAEFSPPSSEYNSWYLGGLHLLYIRSYAQYCLSRYF